VPEECHQEQNKECESVDRTDSTKETKSAENKVYYFVYDFCLF